jgi:hypothetical protein
MKDEVDSAAGGRSGTAKLKVLVLVLFLAQMTAGMLVDGNGRILGLPSDWSLGLVVVLGALLMLFSIWVAMRERRLWWWPVVFAAANVVFLLPAIGGP